jgi:transposase-like protein
MDVQHNQTSCPLCGEDKEMGKKAENLYGYLVCKKCNYAFANRRGFAFLIDLVLPHDIGKE